MKTFLSQPWFVPFLAAQSGVTEIMMRLEEIPRSGWLRHHVSCPEDDFAHTKGLLQVVERLAPRLPELDLERVCQCCFVHEWPEAICGDEVTAGLPKMQEVVALASKKERELAAMCHLCAPLGNVGVFALTAYIEFDDGTTPEGQFTGQIDKFQVMEQAWQYQRLGYTVRAMDFIEHGREVIVHPVLLHELALLEEDITRST